MHSHCRSVGRIITVTLCLMACGSPVPSGEPQGVDADTSPSDAITVDVTDGDATPPPSDSGAVEDIPTAPDAGADGDSGALDCQPGVTMCDGETVLTCGADATWSEIITCTAPTTCHDGACCTPACEGKVCGDDGCGGSCGDCGPDASCTDDGQCACVPGTLECEADGLKVCNPDGLSWTTVATCEFVCHDGECCTPGCEGKSCGDDGCGATCGSCDDNAICDDTGVCQCIPDCEGKACGDDGCGGLCGECGEDAICNTDHTCEACFADCDGKSCGADGCGGSCGQCLLPAACLEGGCVSGCDVVCEGKACGPDGCGGHCGQCAADAVCDAAGQCVDVATCVPDCVGKGCGTNGCGGSCGTCNEPLNCVSGACVDACQDPIGCGAFECGEDACGVPCGACDDGLPCVGGVCNSCVACTGEPGCLQFDWESAGLLGWMHTGEVEVVTALGETPAPQGEKMLLISSGGDAVGGTTSTARYDTCLPEGENWALAFDLRFYSEEFEEYCGGPQQDYLEVSLESASSLVLLKIQIGHLCDGGIYDYGLTPSDIDFDQGGAFYSPWLAVHLPIPAGVAGLPVRLRFEVSDVNDAIFDTAVLVDDLRFEPCDAACAKSVAPKAACPLGQALGCDGDCVDGGGLGDGTCDAAFACAESAWDGGDCEPPCPADQLLTCDEADCLLAESLGDSVCNEGLNCEAYDMDAGDCCEPACAGVVCGDDGCGGECGVCGEAELCVDGACCQPTCAPDTPCTSDGCGGECGGCEPSETCHDGACCEPTCSAEAPCGSDGCGGSCGTCSGAGLCVEGSCECTPQCEGKSCGPDGCGGVCGTCDAEWACVDGGCVDADCGGLECGLNAAGLGCGACDGWPETCTSGVCVCTPQCEGKTCGNDWCGGSCGVCSASATCLPSGTCCTPQCEGKACGDDGCGGSCGTCNDGLACTVDTCDDAGQCQTEPTEDPSCCESVVDCNDGLPCTDDNCLAHSCVNEANGLTCCETVEACDDGLTCTDDSCEEGLCTHVTQSDCCDVDADCADGYVCTDDICGADATCSNPPTDEPDCCESTAACDDGLGCTDDTCQDNTCTFVDNGLTCCEDADACDDGLFCTVDTCDEGVCVQTPQSDCCEADASCDDDDPCTGDSCPQPGEPCVHVDIEGCCLSHDDCDDGVYCTKDSCVDHQCETVDGCCSETGCPASDPCHERWCAAADGCVTSQSAELACCDASIPLYDFESPVPFTGQFQGTTCQWEPVTTEAALGSRALVLAGPSCNSNSPEAWLGAFGVPDNVDVDVRFWVDAVALDGGRLTLEVMETNGPSTPVWSSDGCVGGVCDGEPLPGDGPTFVSTSVAPWAGQAVQLVFAFAPIPFGTGDVELLIDDISLEQTCGACVSHPCLDCALEIVEHGAPCVSECFVDGVCTDTSCVAEASGTFCVPGEIYCEGSVAWTCDTCGEGPVEVAPNDCHVLGQECVDEVGCAGSFGTVLPGTIVVDEDITWTLEGSPWILDGATVVVSVGGSLTLEAGIEVWVRDALLKVNAEGVLVVAGADDAPVTIRSLVPGASWQGISVTSPQTLSLSHLHLDAPAYRCISIVEKSTSGSVLIEDSVIRGCDEGIHLDEVYRSGSDAIRRNVIIDNGLGLSIRRSNLLFEDNDIVHNNQGFFFTSPTCGGGTLCSGSNPLLQRNLIAFSERPFEAYKIGVVFRDNTVAYNLDPMSVGCFSSTFEGNNFLPAGSQMFAVQNTCNHSGVGNWWAGMTGEAVAALITDINDDVNVGHFSYEPVATDYLTAPPLAPVSGLVTSAAQWPTVSWDTHPGPVVGYELLRADDVRGPWEVIAAQEALSNGAVVEALEGLPVWISVSAVSSDGRRSWPAEPVRLLPFDDVCAEDPACCQLTCDGAVCGDNGCGGVCGVCDDGLDCTDDSCDDGLCSFTPTDIPNCCEVTADCDDGLPCTDDVCDANLCVHTDNGFTCCEGEAECDDGLLCTVDTCAEGLCDHAPLADCCDADAECDDGEVCTDDVCPVPGQPCANDPIPECCLTSESCQDGDTCTYDTCADLSCETFDTCCVDAETCDDGDPCTVDTCDEGACSNVQAPDCCVSDALLWDFETPVPLTHVTGDGGDCMWQVATSAFATSGQRGLYYGRLPGTVMDCTYTTGLVSLPLTVPPGHPASLGFTLVMDAEASAEFNVFIGGEHGTDHALNRYGSDGGGSLVVDLSPYVGAAVVVRFEFKTTNSGAEPWLGALVDDVTLLQSCDECASPNALLPDCMTCTPAFTGAACDQCANPNKALPDCESCAPAFTGDACDACANPNKVLPECEVCTPAFTGAACDQCANPNKALPDCESCNPGLAGDACDAYAFTALAAGQWHTCGLRPDGSAMCWGHNLQGQSADKPGPFTALSAGSNHTCGLELDGGIFCWGNNQYGQLTGVAVESQSSGFTGYHPGPFDAVAAGGSHTCGLETSGSIVCWGWNAYGQSEDQAGGFKAVTAGWSHNCGLTLDDDLVCWGSDIAGTLTSEPGPFTATSAGGSHQCSLRADQSARCAGHDQYGQSDDKSGPFTALATGSYHSCGLTPEGAADCWGRNDFGQANSQPGPFSALSGGEHTCGLTPDGEVSCWGVNGDGQTDVPTP